MSINFLPLRYSERVLLHPLYVARCVVVLYAFLKEMQYNTTITTNADCNTICITTTTRGSALGAVL